MGQLSQKISRIRGAIRQHRNQRGDNRCWLDDYLVWKTLDEDCGEPVTIPDDAMDRCRAFYEFRRSDTFDETSLGTSVDREHVSDADLEGMEGDDLMRELDRVTTQVRSHRDINGRPRTLDDDRALYAVLPDQSPADFRLPAEDKFLGEALAPRAGCPAFWRSHANCPTGRHDFHRWGPCNGS